METTVPNTADAIRPEEKQQQCPECQAIVPVHSGYVKWCDQCGWNLNPLEPEPSRDLFGSLYASIGKRSSQGLFHKMMRAKSLKPAWTLSKLLAFVMAIVVHVITLACAVVGVWLFAAGWPNPVILFFGFLFVLIAWFLRPRFPKLSDQVVTKEEFPTLYRIVDEIAQALGTSGAHGIVIDGEFNAAFGQVGWRRNKVLYIGLPLFLFLDGQERVALMAHELAHGVNGDPRRGLVIGTAISTLGRWYTILYPDALWPRGTGLEGLLTVPFNLMRWALANLAYLSAYVLAHLLWRDTQRAEYLADALAMRVSGTDAALSSLDKSHFQSTFSYTVKKAAVGSKSQKQNLFDAFQHNVAKMPKRELERIRRLVRLQGTRLDVTHPPTAYRIELLNARSVVKPQVVLAASEWEKIERELSLLQESIETKIVDQYLASLYH